MTSRWGLSRIHEQRCFFLFLALLVLLVATPFLGETSHGRILVGLFNAIVLATAVAMVAHSRLSLVVAALLAVPTLACQITALRSGLPEHFALSWGFAAAFYAFAIAHLLQYVLRRELMTADKLYGAVAAYIMIAIWWSFMSGVLQYFYPGAYAFQGTPTTLALPDLIFFSFTVMTTAGFGDITPVLIQSRFLTILEALTGVMYVAVLIARLTGVYPVVTKP